MGSKFNSAPRSSPAASPADEFEFEWLLCLCSTFQSARHWLPEDGYSSFRVIRNNGRITAHSSRELKLQDLPATAKAPIRSPARTTRGMSRKRLAG